jgi:hypothetical protein
MSKPWLPWLTLAGVVFVGVQILGRPQGTGAPRPVDWHAEPAQADTDRAPFHRSAGRREFDLLPRAEMEVAARVAGTERYRFDELAPLAPVDAILTWGDLPEPPFAGRISYDQMARFYLWSTHSRDLDLRYIERHSANFHLMPGSENVRRALVRLDVGDDARLRGLLVDVSDDSGRRFKTSLTRNDTGAGACEILWVEEIQVGDAVFH